jgi:hypothetical protein
MQTQTKRTWWARFKRLSLFLGVVLGLLILLAYALEGVIGRKIVAEVQDNLKTELTVANVNFSLVLSFPNAALDLKGVMIEGTDKQPMLKADLLRFKLNIWDIFASPLRIKAIVIKKGVFLLKTNALGKNNYDIFKPSKSEDNKEVAFVLEKAVLESVVIGYENKKTSQDLGLSIKNAAFSGDFSAQKYLLKSEASLICHGITQQGRTFLPEKKLSYKADIQIDRVKNSYTIAQLETTIEQNEFELSGKVIALKKDAYNLDVNFQATKCNIGSLLQIFPQAALQDFSGDGDFSLKGSIKGVSSIENTPNIKVDMQLRNGKLTSPRLQDALEKVSFSAVLRSEGQQSYFSLPDFKGYFGNQPLTLQLHIQNLKTPKIDFFLDGKIPLASTFGLLNNPNLKTASGFIALRDIKIVGALEDMKKVSSIGRVEMSGALVAENIALAIKDDEVTIPTGNLSFANNTFLVEKVKLSGVGTNMLFNGNFYNLLPVLLSDSLHHEATLDFRASLYADKLNVKRFTALFDTPNETQATATKKAETLPVRKPLISYLNGIFEAQIDEFNYDAITGKNFDGHIGFEQDNLLLRGQVETMQGKVALNGRLAMQREPNLSVTILCENFDTKTFFKQCNNFGQDVLKAENIAGRMDARMAIDAYWDKNWNFQDKSLYMLAYLKVRDGHINDVKMLEDFSTYVKIQDLKNIKFTDMENWFEISNSTLRIPVMTVRNNALNLTISGKHSFEGAINYNFKINAASVVVSRFKKFNPKLEPQEDIEHHGFLDLYFNMAGTLDKYKILMSKKVVKADFEESAMLKREIQAKLEAIQHGKDFKSNDTQLFNDTPTAVVNSNKTKNNAKTKKNKEDEYDYIDGF